MKYVIRKVPERDTSYLERLIPEAIVFNDKAHIGAIMSFIGAIRCANDDAVYVQDDMLLCKSFVDRANEYIKRYPDNVIVFSNFTNGEFTRDTTTEGFYRPKQGCWLLCTYIPKEIASGFVKWWTLEKWRTCRDGRTVAYWLRRQYDDIFFRQYLIEQKQQVFVVVPNLAGHPKNVSVIDRRPPKITPNFDYKNAEV